MSLHGPVMSWAPHVTFGLFFRIQLSNNVPAAYSSPVSRLKHPESSARTPYLLHHHRSLPALEIHGDGGREGGKKRGREETEASSASRTISSNSACDFSQTLTLVPSDDTQRGGDMWKDRKDKHVLSKGFPLSATMTLK